MVKGISQHSAKPYPLAHTHSGLCQYTPWPGDELLKRSAGKIELSCPCSCGRLWALQRSYLPVACPWAPSGQSPVCSFFFLSLPIRVSCLSSLSKTTKYSQLLRKAFVLEKMSRLAFRPRRKMEMALFGTDPISVETAFYSKVVGGGVFVVCNQSCSCSRGGHQEGARGSAEAAAGLLLPQRKEQSHLNPSGLLPWAVLGFTSPSTDHEYSVFSRHAGTTSSSLPSPPRPVSFSPSFSLSFYAFVLLRETREELKSPHALLLKYLFILSSFLQKSLCFCLFLSII